MSQRADPLLPAPSRCAIIRQRRRRGSTHAGMGQGIQPDTATRIGLAGCVGRCVGQHAEITGQNGRDNSDTPFFSHDHAAACAMRTHTRARRPRSRMIARVIISVSLLSQSFLSVKSDDYPTHRPTHLFLLSVSHAFKCVFSIAYPTQLKMGDF